VNWRHSLTGFIALWFFVSSLAAVVWAQDRDAIIAKAKEEKVFVYYSTTDIRDGTAMVHAFQKKYPFIEPKLLRLGSTQVVVKVLQEHRGGVHLFDVISATSFQFYEIHKEGCFKGTTRWSGALLPTISRTRKATGSALTTTPAWCRTTPTS
jgi:hypothetical protein